MEAVFGQHMAQASDSNVRRPHIVAPRGLRVQRSYPLRDRAQTSRSVEVDRAARVDGKLEDLVRSYGIAKRSPTHTQDAGPLLIRVEVGIVRSVNFTAPQQDANTCPHLREQGLGAAGDRDPNLTAT